MKKSFFLPFFAQKKHMRKWLIFWQKPWTNPFAKCWYSLILLELHFSGLKSNLFYQEYKKMLLSGFFCLKKTYEKRSIFWQKPWTNPFAKCRYSLTLLELHFSGLKSIVFYPEYEKMFLSAFFCSKKICEKKVDFLTRTMDLQNVDFFRLFENFTFEVQKALFSIQNIKKCFFLPFFAKKKHIRKRSIFWQKPWTNPFAKCRFFRIL